jgi:Uma2 family endonuclease
VVELKSPSDSLQLLKDKMLEWIENGCLLAWLVLPEEEKVYVYRGDGTRDVFDGFDQELSGERTLPGFKLNLSLLRV